MEGSRPDHMVDQGHAAGAPGNTNQFTGQLIISLPVASFLAPLSTCSPAPFIFVLILLQAFFFFFPVVAGFIPATSVSDKLLGVLFQNGHFVQWDHLEEGILVCTLA